MVEAGWSFSQPGHRPDRAVPCQGLLLDVCPLVFSSCKVQAYKMRPNAEDKAVTDTLTQAIANFAKTGDPSPDAGSLFRQSWTATNRCFLRHFLIALFDRINNLQNKWTATNNSIDLANSQ